MGNHKANPFARGTIVERAVRVKDALGRVLVEGDEVCLQSTELRAPVVRVAAVRPVLDASAPPNHVRLQFLMPITIFVPADQPLPGIFRVRSQTELEGEDGDARVTEN